MSQKLLISFFIALVLGNFFVLFAGEMPLKPGSNEPAKPTADVLKNHVMQIKSLFTEMGKSVDALEAARNVSATADNSSSRDEQVRNVRSIRDKLISIRSQLSPKTRRTSDQLRLELEKLTFSFATGDDTQEIKKRFNNVNTLLTVLSSRVLMTCGACKGTGKDSWGSLCKACGGDGYVSTPENAKPCAACNGSGKDAWGSLCKACNGSGWAGAGHNGGTLSPCAFCQKTGKDSWGNPCKVCGGDGYVITKPNPKPCAACSGTGKDAWADVCKACKGSGWAEYNPDSHPDHPSHGNWSLKPCGLCKGLGKDSWGTPCKPCGGDGFVAVQGNPHPCAACQGNGKDSWGTICKACQGTGWAETTSNPEWGGHTTSTVCGWCKGTGKDSWGSLCKICGGDGYVSAPTDQKTCALCQGTGKDSWGAICSGCKGTGQARTIHGKDSNMDRKSNPNTGNKSKIKN